jgi:hypothetical protein
MCQLPSGEAILTFKRLVELYSSGYGERKKNNCQCSCFRFNSDSVLHAYIQTITYLLTYLLTYSREQSPS